MINHELLTKLGEQLVLQSKIKEKFKALSDIGDQMKQLRDQQTQMMVEIEELAVQAQDVADWLLEQEYKALV